MSIYNIRRRTSNRSTDLDIFYDNIETVEVNAYQSVLTELINRVNLYMTDEIEKMKQFDYTTFFIFWNEIQKR